MVSRNPQHQPPRSLEVHDHLRRAVDELRRYDRELEITMDGKPVARFVPVRDTMPPTAAAELVQFFQQFGATHSLGGAGWKAFRDEGRR